MRTGDEDSWEQETWGGVAIEAPAISEESSLKWETKSSNQRTVQSWLQFVGSAETAGPLRVGTQTRKKPEKLATQTE